MNNKVLKSNYVMFMVFLAIIIFAGIICMIVKPAFDNCASMKEVVAQNQLDLQRAQKEVDESKSSLQKEEDLLKTIKAIYNSSEPGKAENLSAFGTMFDDVIQRIQQNGLMIRAIEYQMNPELDPVVVNFSKDYNVCALKFFLVGSYAQLKTLLDELNTTFPYLVGISKTNVIVYQDNTDYILADIAITLYSKKATNN